MQRLETVISSKESMLQRLSESVAEVDWYAGAQFSSATRSRVRQLAGASRSSSQVRLGTTQHGRAPRLQHQAVSLTFCLCRSLPDESPSCRGRHPLVELCVDSFIPNDLGLVRAAAHLRCSSLIPFWQIGGYGDGVRTGESILSVKEQGYLDHETSVLLLSGANFSVSTPALARELY